MNTQRFAFTMIELVFSIVIIAIIGKFGVEFLSQAYKSFLFTNINHQLQSNSATAVELIASRLQYRIKDSVIARTSPAAPPVAIGSASGSNYTVLEWVGFDNEGFRGNCDDNTAPIFHKPNWSGILDLNAGSAAALISPETNTTATDNLIKILSDNNTSIADIALYFPGSNSDIKSGYGWDGNLTAINAQQGTMHPVTSVAGNEDQFTSSTGTDFSGIDIYEYYKLAWTAYALVYQSGTNNKGTLTLYWNYQPWLGENFNTTQGVKSAVLMENVDTFQFTSIGSVLKIQVCVKSDLVEDYSICKEKTVF